MSQNKPKFLLATVDYPPAIGGVARYYKNLVDNLGPEKIDVFSFELNEGRRLAWLPSLGKIVSALQNKNYKYLLVGHVLPLGYAALLAKFFFKKPYLVFTHGKDILTPQKNWWKKWWLQKILQAAQIVVANSFFTKKELINLGMVESKIQVIFPCIKKNEKGIETKKEEKIILSVGRLVERKGFDVGIKAMPKILESNPQVKYVLIGQGPDENRLKKIVQEFNLQDKVIFPGAVNEEELENWYNKASLFLLPCRKINDDVEGLGTVFLEAANHGLPVVVGNSGGAPETIMDQKTGFLVDPKSLKEIAGAVIKLLSNEDLAKEMGLAGKKMVEEKFVCSLQFEKLKKMLD